jgi:hypothetical protein
MSAIVLPCHRLEAGTVLQELALVVRSVLGDAGTTRVESRPPDAGSSA